MEKNDGEVENLRNSKNRISGTMLAQMKAQE
jgi:hypothetical protein